MCGKVGKFKVNKQRYQNDILLVSSKVFNNLHKADFRLWNLLGDNKLSDAIHEIYEDYIKQINDCLIQIRKSIIEFEDRPLDFKKALEKIDHGNNKFEWGYKDVDVSTSGFFEETNGETAKISVVGFMHNGKFVTLAEATNAFYTLSPTLNYLLLADKEISNQDDFDKYATDFIVSSDSTFKKWLVKGYFSIANTDDIDNTYRNSGAYSFLDGSITSQFQKMIKSLVDEGSKDVVLTNSKTTTGIGMAAAVAAGLGGFKGLEELTKPTETPNTSNNTNSWKPTAGEQYEKENNKLKTEVENLETENQKLKEEIEKIKEEMAKAKEKEVAAIKESMASIEKEPLPEKVKMEEISSDDIDAEARDKFYAENDVSQSRYENLEDFRAMDYDKKVEELQKVGYTELDAKKLATDIAMGGTAFVLGKESLQIANISNQLASSSGFSNHTTKFGTQLNYEYINSGNANYDLGIMTNNDLMQSRFNVNAAKQDYSLAVNDANIANANLTSAKQDYDKVLNSIKAESGDDPSNWTSAQIASYNQATNNYDKALSESKTANENVDKCKKKYSKAKEDYNQVYEDIRENVIRDVDATKNNIDANPLPNTEILDENFNTNTSGESIETQINDSIKFGEDNLTISNGDLDSKNSAPTYVNSSFMTSSNEQNVDNKQPITIENDTIVINDDIFKLDDLL